MSSTSANARRTPTQARATLRRERFLNVAARLIEESGFDVVTMTAIAQCSGASIGALYDYFPDKQTLALALMAKYAEESDSHWKRLLENPLPFKKSALAGFLVEGTLDFAQQRPAYLSLFGAPFVTPRSAAARQPLRRTFASALRRLNPRLSTGRALIYAQVIVELIKAMLTVCKQIDPKDRDGVTLEFKKILRFYLSTVLK